MDFMFEDEVDEVGSDVEAYCPKCKGDTTHVVISKYEDEIRRVQCNPCGDVHSFRKPRGDVEEDVPEPIAAKKRAMLKKPTFEEFFAKHSDKNARPYEFREQYHENVVVTHPKFGKGFVSEILSDSKAEVTFKDSRRVLVHNRKDMPGLPLAAEGDGHPSNAKIAKISKTGKGKEGKDVKEGKEAAKDAKPAKETAAREPREAKEAKEAKDVKEGAKSAGAKVAKPVAASRSHVSEKTAPAAKAAKRTSKPARPLRSTATHGRASGGKSPAKAAKRGKK
jgi:hypothetical protein